MALVDAVENGEDAAESRWDGMGWMVCLRLLRAGEGIGFEKTVRREFDEAV